MKNLTQRQREVAGFIGNYMDANGYAPSVRNIADHFGFSAKAAYDHITILRKKNIIRTENNVPRGIIVLKNLDPEAEVMINVPILGEKEGEYKGYLTFSQDFLGILLTDAVYAYEVTDDDMSDSGIRKGDIAVFLRTGNIQEGQLVLVQDGKIKRFFKHDENFDLRTFNYGILGKVLFVFKKF